MHGCPIPYIVVLNDPMVVQSIEMTLPVLNTDISLFSENNVYPLCMIIK